MVEKNGWNQAVEKGVESEGLCFGGYPPQKRDRVVFAVFSELCSAKTTSQGAPLLKKRVV